MNDNRNTSLEVYNGETWVVHDEPCERHDHEAHHSAWTIDNTKIGTAIYIDGEFDCIDDIEIYSPEISIP